MNKNKSNSKKKRKRDPNPTNTIISPLSEQLLSEEEIKSAFQLFDCDDSGTIEFSEMKLVLSALGYNDISNEEIYKLIDTIDLDKSGTISYLEFKLMMSNSIYKILNPNNISEAYKLIDIDNKGNINISDLRRVIEELGILYYSNGGDRVRVAETDLIDMIKLGMSSSNGKEISINEAEFIKLMEQIYENKEGENSKDSEQKNI